jgi:pimeloyl-ACP methyl ester carboxylesterase
MAFLHHNGAAIYYEAAGEGPAVLFIHAGIADSRMWDDQWEAFARDFRVVRFDTRGFGRTVTEDVEYSNRDDVRALMDHLGIGRAALIGCSRGGQIALDTVIESPERAWALVTVCGGLGGFNPQVEIPQEQIDRFEELDRLSAAGEWQAVVELETLTFVDGWGREPGTSSASVRERVTLMNTESVAHVDEGGRPIVLDPPAIDRLDRVRVPTLVCIGVYDETYSQLAADEMARRIDGARKLVFEHSAHVPSMEEPEKFNAEVVAFLKAAAQTSPSS